MVHGDPAEPVNPPKERTERIFLNSFFETAPLSPTGRLLLADRRSPLEHFWPKNLVLSAVHAAAFTAAPALAAATPGPDADDEDELLDWERLAEELKDFKKRALYTTYDLTGLVKPSGAANALGVWLGNGWWSCGPPPGTTQPACDAKSPPQMLARVNAMECKHEQLIHDATNLFREVKNITDEQTQSNNKN